MDKLGYCCINTQLRKKNIFCSRSMIKRTFTKERASNLALQNVIDLLAILKWNELHNIKVFRISSDILPRYTCKEHGYSFTELHEHEQIAEVLSQCGDFAKKHNHDLSFHPGQYNVLCSNREDVVCNTIAELEYHSMLCDLIDNECVLQMDINIHVGATYGGEYENTALRFNKNFEKLSSRLKKRLTIENDDKPCPGGWSVEKLYTLIHKNIGIPITWDIHHSQFSRPQHMSLSEEYTLARSTWGDKKMMIHYSESANDDKLVRGHSFDYKKPLPSFLSRERNYRVELECKGKEQGLITMRNLLARTNKNSVGLVMR